MDRDMKHASMLEGIAQEKGVPAQRSMGGAMRVIATGAMLVVAVAAGYGWGESSTSAPSPSMSAVHTKGRQQKLWESAMSKKLATKIARDPALVHLRHLGAAAEEPAAHEKKAVRAALVKSAAKAAPKVASTTATAKAAPSPVPKASPKASHAKAAPVASEKSQARTGEKKHSLAQPASRSHRLATAPISKATHAGRKEDSTAVTKHAAAAPNEKKEALERLAEKEKEAALSSKVAASGAPQAHADQIHKATKAKVPKKGSQEWEREQDANFFDSLGHSHSVEESRIRQIKDRKQRQNAKHEMFEQREEEKVHEGDEKARKQQRDAELAAKQYTVTAFEDMDKHLTSIRADSVTGFKTMEAKELASEVERDHPNESAQQIAARAMKLLGLVMKGRGSDPQVSGTNIVSPLGPMGVAPQVGM